MSDLVEARKLKGFRDYAPAAARLRKQIIDRVYAVATQAGFQPIITPALEYAETLLGSGGGDTDKEVYHFEDHGQRAVALRFDLTVPFARYVAENQGTLVFPFKKLQIGEVWRGEKPQKGRYREFGQADLDIIGVDSLAADVEILACMSAVLSQFAPLRFSTAIGHRVLLAALIRRLLGVASVEHEARIIISIDKLAKIGAAGVSEQLLKIPGIAAEGVAELLAVLTPLPESGDSDLDRVESLVADSEMAAAELERYRQTLTLLRGLERPGVSFKADLSLARGLGYYTGIVFETTIDGLPGFGSVSGGGRYNRLVSRFSSQEYAGVGGSLGVDRFLTALEEHGHSLSEPLYKPQVFIAVAAEEARAYAMSMAESLRQAGIITDLALKPGKVAQQFRYADRQGFSVVLVVGGEELSQQCFTLKVLATGAESRGLLRSELLTIVKQHFKLGL